jgi:hypothetical protein
MDHAPAYLDARSRFTLCLERHACPAVTPKAILQEKDGVQHELFKPCVMKKPVATKWGSVSLVKAHVALIKEALKNKQTQCAPTSCASMLLADGVLRAVLSPVGLRPLPCADTEVDLFMSGGLCCSAIPAFRLCPSIRSTRSVRTCA